MAETQNPSTAKSGKQSAKVDYRARTHRKPMTGIEQRLNAEVPSELKGYWFLDEPGRIQRAIEAGWRFARRQDGVITETDDRDDEEVIYIEHGMADQNGRSVRQYLMTIPLEIWQEDRKARAERGELVKDRIKRGTFAEEQGDARYDTRDRISIKDTVG